MLTTRLIPILYLMNGLIVRSEGFRTHQIIGNVVDEARRYAQWDIDELVYIDITREGSYDQGRDDHAIKGIASVPEMLDAVAEFTHTPLAVGGQIRTVEQARKLLRNGADKVVLNSHVPELGPRMSRAFGCQALVASVDYRGDGKGAIVYTQNGYTDTGVPVLDWVARCEEAGAGEILLNSIDRDGKGCGFDIPTIRMVVEATRLPVVACGGAGDDWDFVECAKETGASGIAAGNFFHFTEHSYPRVKALMRKEGINVRPPSEDEVL